MFPEPAVIAVFLPAALALNITLVAIFFIVWDKGHRVGVAVG